MDLSLQYRARRERNLLSGSTNRVG
jgi:hypothetical protein